jgi:CheY-like chemotaxis protein
MKCRSLAQCRIFYLEDDFFIAEETRENLVGAGAGDVVLCGSVPRALELLEDTRFDAALLDFNIAGSTSVPVARRFRQTGVPILFVTAYDRDILPADLSSCALIRKPASSEVVIREMEAMLCACAANDTGAADGEARDD